MKQWIAAFLGLTWTMAMTAGCQQKCFISEKAFYDAHVLPANLENGDSYFSIPRVLIAWLLIWECDARPLFVALAARALCLVGVVFELAHHRLPAPPDYHWADYCSAIRRGTPARIPTLPEGWWLEYPGRPPKP